MCLLKLAANATVFYFYFYEELSLNSVAPNQIVHVIKLFLFIHHVSVFLGTTNLIKVVSKFTQDLNLAPFVLYLLFSG